VERQKFVVKSREEMGDYIALNWLEPRLAKKFGIKKNQIFVREDWWIDAVKRSRLHTHELVEINLRLRNKMGYEQAHKIANIFERNALKVIKKASTPIPLPPPSRRKH